jgi:tellurite resistance protein
MSKILDDVSHKLLAIMEVVGSVCAKIAMTDASQEDSIREDMEQFFALLADVQSTLNLELSVDEKQCRSQNTFFGEHRDLSITNDRVALIRRHIDQLFIQINQIGEA